MYRNLKILQVCVIFFLATTLLFCSGCTSTNSDHVTSVPPTISAAPLANPYGLDNDGYYIADLDERGSQIDPNCCFSWCYTYVDCNNTYANLYFNDGFNISLKTPAVTSGEVLVIEGTSKLLPNTIVAMTIVAENLDGSLVYQQYSAPTLPLTTPNIDSDIKSLIKIKIPALNIHAFNYGCRLNNGCMPLQLRDGEKLNYSVTFGHDYQPFTITYDSNYPLITEENRYRDEPSMGPCPKSGCDFYWRSNWWVWTNNTDIKHVWYRPNLYNIYSNLPSLMPYPTITNQHRLDNDGYYIADFDSWDVPRIELYDDNLRYIDIIRLDLRGYIAKSVSGKPHDFVKYCTDIKLQNSTITSGDSLILTGYSSISELNRVPIFIKRVGNDVPYIQTHQTFSAPLFALKPNETQSYLRDLRDHERRGEFGGSGVYDPALPSYMEQGKRVNYKTELKVKIPASNIHLDPTTIVEPLVSGTKINGLVYVADFSLPFTIIYDSNHPMIFENTTQINTENTTTTWSLTTEPLNIHTWINPNNQTKVYRQSYLVSPYPTYPKPQQTW